MSIVSLDPAYHQRDRSSMSNVQDTNGGHTEFAG
jgi:hypothetical protein